MVAQQGLVLFVQVRSRVVQQPTDKSIKRRSLEAFTFPACLLKFYWIHLTRTSVRFHTNRCFTPICCSADPAWTHCKLMSEKEIRWKQYLAVGCCSSKIYSSKKSGEGVKAVSNTPIYRNPRKHFVTIWHSTSFHGNDALSFTATIHIFSRYLHYDANYQHYDPKVAH